MENRMDLVVPTTSNYAVVYETAPEVSGGNML